MNLELTSLTLGRRVEGGGNGTGTGAVNAGVDWPVLVYISVGSMRNWIKGIDSEEEERWEKTSSR